MYTRYSICAHSFPGRDLARNIQIHLPAPSPPPATQPHALNANSLTPRMPQAEIATRRARPLTPAHRDSRRETLAAALCTPQSMRRAGRLYMRAYRTSHARPMYCAPTLAHTKNPPTASLLEPRNPEADDATRAKSAGSSARPEQETAPLKAEEAPRARKPPCSRRPHAHNFQRDGSISQHPCWAAHIEHARKLALASIWE